MVSSCLKKQTYTCYNCNTYKRRVFFGGGGERPGETEKKRLSAFFGAGLTGGLGGGFGRGGFQDFIAKLAVRDLVKSDIHEGHPGTDGDHRAVAEAELADTLGNHVDEDLGVGNLGKGAMDKF